MTEPHSDHFQNGDEYVGLFVDGLMSGTGTFTWADGRKYYGSFSSGKPHGNGTITFAANDPKFRYPLPFCNSSSEAGSLKIRL